MGLPPPPVHGHWPLRRRGPAASLVPASPKLASDPKREPQGKHEETGPGEPKKQLLCPVARPDFREQVQAFVKQVPDPDRSQQQTKTGSGATEDHRSIDGDRTYQTAHVISRSSEVSLSAEAVLETHGIAVCPIASKQEEVVA